MLATAQAVQAVEGMSLDNITTVGAVNPARIQFEAPIPLLPESGVHLGVLAVGAVGAAMLLGGIAFRRKE
jgi:hypothetical protein